MEQIQEITGVKYTYDKDGNIVAIKAPEHFNITTAYLDYNLAVGRGKRPAYYFEDLTMTYESLMEHTCRLGGALQAVGVEQGERLMVVLQDSPNLIYCWLGAMRIGAVPVITNCFYSSDQYGELVREVRAKILITSGRMLEKLNLSDCPSLKTVLVFKDEGELAKECTDLRQLMQLSSPNLAPVRTHRDDEAYWLWSSGTTGHPKAAVHLHHDLLYLDFSTFNCLKFREDDIVLATPKFPFAYAMQVLAASPLRAGASAVLDPERFSVERLFQLMAKYQPTIYVAVPTAYAALLDNGRDADFPSLRYCLSAGEPLPPVLYQRWKERYGVEILDGLGTTETGSLMIQNHPGRARPGSTGQLIRGIEAKLIDDEGKEVSTGAIGDLIVKIDSTVPYYWRGHDKAKKHLRGEWLFTGDKFSRDEDGYYWYVGRSDDLFKVSAQWVSPSEVESILLEHEAVLEVAVIGEPNTMGIMKSLAFVVLRSEQSPSEELTQALIAHAKSRLSSFKCPKEIRYVDEIPKTSSGKLQRFKLRALSSEQA